MSLIDAGCIKISSLTENDIAPKPDKKRGLSASERQWLQVEKCQKGDKTLWLDYEGLRSEMNSWV